MKKKLLNEFGLKTEEIPESMVSDYETFQNKELLDELRNKLNIVESLKANKRLFKLLINNPLSLKIINVFINT